MENEIDRIGNGVSELIQDVGTNRRTWDVKYQVVIVVLSSQRASTGLSSSHGCEPST
jgi:putative component of toxin-antitoxin plasmid stabilization module